MDECKSLMTKPFKVGVNTERAKRLFEQSRVLVESIISGEMVRSVDDKPMVKRKYLKSFGFAVSKLVNSICDEEGYDKKYIVFSVVKILWAMLFHTDKENLEEIIDLKKYFGLDERYMRPPENVTEEIYRTDFMIMEYKLYELYEFLPKID